MKLKWEPVLNLSVEQYVGGICLFQNRKRMSHIFLKYHKVVSSNTSRLEAHASFFKILEKYNLRERWKQVSEILERWKQVFRNLREIFPKSSFQNLREIVISERWKQIPEILERWKQVPEIACNFTHDYYSL